MTADIPRRSRAALPSNPSTHLFALGQAVQLKDGLWASGRIYLITARLPLSGDLPQYRIRNDDEQFERMAMEASLESVNAAARGKSELPRRSLSALVEDRGSGQS